MFHILETRPTKVRWCWRAHGNAAPPLHHPGKKPFSCFAWRLSEAVVTQPGVALPAPVPCGIPQAPRHPCGVPVSRGDSPARIGLVGLGGLGVCSIHQSQGSTLDAVQPPSVRGCTRHPGEGRRTLSKAVSGPL
ncbi:hypothetical protein GWK47_004221 [Chionoecetes opilio]|uniref:Uncharacterized protein n=1 Tax=Chionoecetes opilio TaxID=41210 RepID=A0A8J4YEQ4_CHIOP|nr:hypothetical protein GWK47_004221 [Chionoecetes opilio]